MVRSLKRMTSHHLSVEFEPSNDSQHLMFFSFMAGGSQRQTSANTSDIRQLTEIYVHLQRWQRWAEMGGEDLERCSFGPPCCWRPGWVLEERHAHPAAGMNTLIGSGSPRVSCVRLSRRTGFEPHTWKQQGFMGNGRRFWRVGPDALTHPSRAPTAVYPPR